MEPIDHELKARFGPDIRDTDLLYDMQLRGDRRPIDLQYDPYNRRLKFFDLRPSDARANPAIAAALGDAEGGELFSKVIVYARPGQADWPALGLRREAVIRGFFGNGDAAELWAAYPLPLRGNDIRQAEGDRVAALAVQKKRTEPVLPPGYVCVPATATDAPSIAELMTLVFKDYPTPISAPRIAQAIARRTSRFRLVRDARAGLVACGSAEIHHSRRSAELTDCATRPAHRGRGLMRCILRALEHDLRAEFGITDCYTIARAYEPGMNVSFARLGYHYTGRLVNNCRMPDGFESMNVWCRNTRESVDAP